MDSARMQSAEKSPQETRIPSDEVDRRSRKERDFRKAVRAVFRETRPLAAGLRGLESIDSGAWPARASMRHHIVRYAAHEAGVRIVQRRLYKIYLSSFVLVYLVSPLLILGAWLRLRLSLDEWISVYVIYAVSFVFLLLLILPIRLITQRNLEELFFPWRGSSFAAKGKTLRGPDTETNRAQLQWRDSVAISWVMLIAGFSGYLFLLTLAERQSLFTSSESMAFVPVFFSWSFWLLGGMLFLTIGSMALYIRRRQLNTRYPETVICIRLLEALSLLERHADAWGEPTLKRVLVEKLEEAALRVAFDLQRQQRSGDATTDAWLGKSFAGIARSLREQKKRILLPEAGARQALVDFLARELQHAAAGELGSLERIEQADPTERRVGALKRLSGFLSAAIRGSLPLVALWLVQQSPFAIQSNLIDYGFTLAAIYLLISILSEVDPLYKDKIGAIREVMNLTYRG